MPPPRRVKSGVNVCPLDQGSGGTTSLCGRVRGQVMKVAAARVLDEASALADSHLPAS